MTLEEYRTLKVGDTISGTFNTASNTEGPYILIDFKLNGTELTWNKHHSWELKDCWIIARAKPLLKTKEELIKSLFE